MYLDWWYICSAIKHMQVSFEGLIRSDEFEGLFWSTNRTKCGVKLPQVLLLVESAWVGMVADLQIMHWFISTFVCVRPRDIYDILVDESGVRIVPVLYFLLHMKYVYDIQ